MTGDFYLAFDPGGEGAFGWAVARRVRDGAPDLVATGCAPNAAVAIANSGRVLGASGVPVAAGIDAPLFWTTTGKRRADHTVRRELHAQGAPSPGGTVQSLNSLRGACLVQGVAAATLLRRRWPGVAITETHPKALLWHLGLASRDRAASSITLDALPELLATSLRHVTEHERDAAISCAAAYSFTQRLPGWRDLVVDETDLLPVVPGAVSYWMPVPQGFAVA